MAEIYVERRTQIRFRIIGRLPAEPGWETYVGRSRRWQRDIILHFRTAKDEILNRVQDDKNMRFRAPRMERYRFQVPAKMGTGRIPINPAKYGADFTGPALDYASAAEGE